MCLEGWNLLLLLLPFLSQAWNKFGQIPSNCVWYLVKQMEKSMSAYSYDAFLHISETTLIMFFNISSPTPRCTGFTHHWIEHCLWILLTSLHLIPPLGEADECRDVIQRDPGIRKARLLWLLSDGTIASMTVFAKQGINFNHRNLASQTIQLDIAIQQWELLVLDLILSGLRILVTNRKGFPEAKSYGGPVFPYLLSARLPGTRACASLLQPI